MDIRGGKFFLNRMLDGDISRSLREDDCQEKYSADTKTVN
jgi:hypothetical protein